MFHRRHTLLALGSRGLFFKLCRGLGRDEGFERHLHGNVCAAVTLTGLVAILSGAITNLCQRSRPAGQRPARIAEAGHAHHLRQSRIHNLSIDRIEVAADNPAIRVLDNREPFFLRLLPRHPLGSLRRMLDRPRLYTLFELPRVHRLSGFAQLRLAVVGIEQLFLQCRGLNDLRQHVHVRDRNLAVREVFLERRQVILKRLRPLDRLSRVRQARLAHLSLVLIDRPRTGILPVASLIHACECICSESADLCFCLRQQRRELQQLLARQRINRATGERVNSINDRSQLSHSASFARTRRPSERGNLSAAIHRTRRGVTQVEIERGGHSGTSFR